MANAVGELQETRVEYKTLVRGAQEVVPVQRDGGGGLLFTRARRRLGRWRCRCLPGGLASAPALLLRCPALPPPPKMVLP